MNDLTTNNQSRAESTYQKLLEKIQYGHLKPGTRIRETEIATMLNVSRTPVRDAIRRLESDGFLIHIPRQGAIIKKLDSREIIELYDIRKILEGKAAYYASIHASSSEINELEILNSLMVNSIHDPIKASNANRLFHKSLYNSANNRYLIAALNSLSNSMILLGSTTMETKERIEEAYLEHKKIIEYIKRKDSDAAEKAAENHIKSSYNIRMTRLLESKIEEP